MGSHVYLPGLSLFTLFFGSTGAALHAGWLRYFSPQHPVPLCFYLHSKLCFLRHPQLPTNAHSGLHSCFPHLISPCTLLDCAGISLCCSASLPPETLLMSYCPGAVPAPLPAWSALSLCPAILSCKLPCTAESHSRPSPYLWWSHRIDTVRTRHRCCFCSHAQAHAGRSVNPPILHCTSPSPTPSIPVLP